MNKTDLQKRTKSLGVRIYHLVQTLRSGHDSEVLGKQLLRCATSVGANYRAVCRARSTREFMAKLSICIEECDEVMFWLAFLEEIGYTNLEELRKEANELVAIFVSSRKTAEINLKLEN